MNEIKNKIFRFKGNIKLSLIIFLILTGISSMTTSQDQKMNNPDENNFILAFPKNVLSNVDINDAVAAVKIWGNTLEEQLNIGVQFDIHIFDSAQDIINYKNRDKLGMIILHSPDFLTYKKQMHLDPVTVSYNNNKVHVKFLLLVKDKKYSSLKDLENLNIGVPKIFNNPIPVMWLDVLLAENNLKEKVQFFGKINEYDKESDLIHSVFFGQNDVCIVSETTFETMRELNPQVGEQLKILEESPGYVWGLSCLTESSKKFSYNKKLIDACLDLHNYTSGKQILTLLKTEKVTAYKPEYLVSTEKLLKQYNALSRKK